MKVWIERLKRKSGDKLAVKVVDDNGKKMQRGLFELNQKRQAKVFADGLKQMEPHLAKPAQITFDTAFKAYKESVLKNELIAYETRLHMVGKINNHVAPHIEKKLLTDFTYHDFKEDYIPKLINSNGCKVVNIASKDKYGFTSQIIRTDKKLGKKSIKDAVAEFKLFVKYCLERKWVLDPNILTFNFNKNFFQSENSKKKWMPKYKDVVKLINSVDDPIDVALFHTAAETGIRLNELLGLTYSDIDFTSEPALLHTNHSTDKWNNFRENFLKTDSSKRPIPLSKSLALKLKTFMDNQINVKRAGQYRLIFGTVSKKMAARRVQRAAKKIGIDWQNGMSPFRKFSFSYLKDTGQFTDKQLMQRFGWTNMDTPNKWYYRDLDINRENRLAAIDKMLLN